MSQNKVFLMLFIACWLGSTIVHGVSAPKGPLQNHITGGYKGLQMRSSRSNLDCSQFEGDYDVLYHFSFEVAVNPLNSNWKKSIAVMNGNSTSVVELQLKNEKAIPLSIFCLTNVRYLIIENMPFPDGVVPDNLENLKQLYYLYISNSSIVKMTERLGTLNSLQQLQLQRCSLTSLPNLSGLYQLRSISLDENQLSKLEGLNSVSQLSLRGNLFTDIPTIKNPEKLEKVYMDHNPLKHILKITSHINLSYLYLVNTTLSDIPATIDRLQRLQYLYLTNNKLSFLPTNILNLPDLKRLDIRSNQFTLKDIETILERFKTSRPNTTVFHDT